LAEGAAVRLLGGWIVLVVCALGVTPAFAEVACFPGAEARIAICNSSCSQIFCGYNLPLAGKRHLGSFITYYTNGTDVPLDIPDGKIEAKQYMRVMIPSDDVSLHMSIDEIPDFCCFVQVTQEGGSFSREFRFGANESFVLDDMKQGTYVIAIVHPLKDQGGKSARYVPMVYLAPTVKQDTAGDSLNSARNMGELSKDRKIVVDEYLQAVMGRQPDGHKTQHIVNDLADWFRVTTKTPGWIRVDFRPVAILDSAQVPTSVGYANEFTQGTLPIPKEGFFVEPGTHHVVAQALRGVVDAEFGYRYHLEITFVPKQ
jgi:hypothetical protein